MSGYWDNVVLISSNQRNVKEGMLAFIARELGMNEEFVFLKDEIPTEEKIEKFKKAIIENEAMLQLYGL